MRIVNIADPSAREAIAELQQKLSINRGAEAVGSSEKTVQVFGSPLTPVEAVRRIVGDVRREGDAAVFRYSKLLDGFELNERNIRVSAEEIDAAENEVTPEFLAAAENAINRVGRFQENILVTPPPPIREKGRRLSLNYVPIRRIGVYVPGYSAKLPSSVIMNCVPAQVAGVREIALATPPDASGKVCPEILACCSLLGVNEVYRIGGAQAVAALALGTKSVPRVDMVAGPGNIFTTLAKKEVLGEVAIDILAGPSEVLVLADDSARPEVVAADLLSQAEHAPAAVFVVTPSKALADAVVAEVEKQLAALSRRERTAPVLDEYSLVVLTGTMEEAIAVANDIAPEHVQINTAEPEAIVPKIVNAGAIFVGSWTPVAAGDYCAGPSHTLPTGGTARFFSGLTANAFMKTISVIKYDRLSLEQDSADIIALAEAEGLTAHAESVRARFREKKPGSGQSEAPVKPDKVPGAQWE